MQAIDYGMASLSSEGGTASSSSSDNDDDDETDMVTEIMGTECFVPPEVLELQRYTPAVE